MLLSSLGCKITCFSSSIEALRSFQETPNDFDLVITDMTMPKMNGLDLTKKMFAVRPAISVIMCTGFSELVNKEQAPSLGIKGFFAIPVHGVDLAKTIRRVIES